MVVENRTGYPVDVLYQLENEYTVHTTIADGQDITQVVTDGFTWFFGINSEHLIGQYVSSADPDQKVILNEQTLIDAGVPLPPQTSTIGTGSVRPTPPPPPTFTAAPEIPNDIPKKSEFDDSAIQFGRPTIKGPLVEWTKAPLESVIFLWENDLTLEVKEDMTVGATLSINPDKSRAQTTASFILQEVDGKQGVYRIQNIYYLDSYLYIDENAQPGWPILCGPQGEVLATGEWKLQKGGLFSALISAAKPELRIHISDNGKVSLVRDNALLSGNDPQIELAAKKAGNAFLAMTVESFYDVRDNLVPALVQMDQNLKELKAQQKAKAEEAAHKKQEAEAAEAERRRFARVPNITGGGLGTEHLIVRMGVGDLFETKEGYPSIRYSFAPPGQRPYMTANLSMSPNYDKNQFLDLRMIPEVAAWVQNGKLYVGIETGNATALSIRHGNTNSKDKPTDGNWFIGNLRINQFWQYGQEVVMFPTVENKEVSYGFSSDASRGLNFSFEEIIGADISESRGSNVNFQTKEYGVSGTRGTGNQMVGTVQYEWDAQGIAAAPKRTDNRTYDSPVDLYDPETMQLRRIPIIAHNLPGITTRTIFGTFFPQEALPDQLALQMEITVQTHMVKIMKTTEENTKNKNWEDFKAGFTYVFRPDLWDFEESFEDQTKIKEAMQKPIGFTQDKTFKVLLYIHVEDLKPFMASNSQ